MFTDDSSALYSEHAAAIIHHARNMQLMLLMNGVLSAGAGSL